MQTPSSDSNYATVSTRVPHQTSVVMLPCAGVEERKCQDTQPRQDTAQVSGVRNWDVTFCGCFSSLVPSCFMSTTCPCVAIAQIQARLGNCYATALYGHSSTIFGLLVCILLFITHNTAEQDDQHQVSSAVQARQPAGGQQILFLCGTMFFYLVYAATVGRLRTRVRREFQIDGNCGTDCVVAMCCPQCTIAQMASQTQSYIPGSCSFRQPRADTLPGYPATPAMAFA